MPIAAKDAVCPAGATLMTARPSMNAAPETLPLMPISVAGVGQVADTGGAHVTGTGATRV
jgi:hypothetical protein